ncbi:MAG: MFS transporter [Bacteroidota bacterium]
MKPLLLRNFPFLRLWIGQVTSQIGDRIFQLALAWWVLQSTGNAFYLGLLMVLSSLPAVVLGPIGGAALDAFDRKKVMVLADLGRALLVGTLAFLALRGQLSIGWVFATVPLLAALAAFFNPGISASIPQLVEEADLNEGVALQTMMSSFAGFIGPVFGGGLIAILGVGGGLAFDVASYLVSALLLGTLPLSKGTGKTQLKEVASQLVEGLRFTLAQKTLFRLLLGFAGTNLFLVPNMILLPMYVSLVLKGTPAQLGFLEGAIAVGMAAASAWIAHRGEVANKRFLVLFMILLTAVASLGMGLARDAYASIALQLLIGVAVAGINVNLGLVFQRMVPPEMKGRFFSLVEMVSFCSFPLAFFWAGLAARATSVPVTYFLCAGGLVLVTVYLAGIPGLSEIGKEESKVTVP